MKKKCLAYLLTASLCAASVVPVFGAEFTSAPEEPANVEVFTSGEEVPEFQQGEEIAVPEPELEEVQAAEYYEEVERAYLEVAQMPYRTHYAYPVQAEGIQDLVLDGLIVELHAEDGRVIDRKAFGNTELPGGETSKFPYFVYASKDGESVYENFGGTGECEIEIYCESDIGDLTADDGTQITKFKIQLEDPDTFLPEVQKKSDTFFELTQNVESDLKGAYARFVPEKSGCYYLRAEGNSMMPGTLSYRVKGMWNNATIYDDSSVYLEKGVPVYLIYKVESYDPGMNVRFTVEEEPEIVRMEWVEKPKKPLYSDVTAWKFAGSDRYDATYADGKIKVIYSNGEEEVFALKDGPKTGYYIESSIGYKGKGSIKPGTYKTTFNLRNYKMPDDSAMKLTLTADVVVKSPKSLPTIKNKGSKTVDFEGLRYSSSFVRFETGAGTEYKIWCSLKEPGAEVVVKAGPYAFSGQTNGGVVTLNANSVYYLTYNGEEIGNHDKITYSVKPVKKSLSECTVEVPKNVVYTGKAIRPKVVLRSGMWELKPGRDYSVKYSGGKEVGQKGVIKITGKGSYTGSLTKTFMVIPGKTSIKTAKRNAKGQITLSWNKAKGAAEYLVMRSENGKKWSKAGTTKGTAFTDKKAKKGVTYRYKIRAYKKVGKKNVYGAYSSVKKVK